MTYTFLAAIPGRDLEDDYRAWVIRKLAAEGISIEADLLMLNSSLVGMCTFVDRDAGRAMLPEAARSLVDDPGPFTGPVVGYFHWTCAIAPYYADDLAPAIVAISNLIARTDNGAYRAVVRPVEYPLSNLLTKFGFHDGDAMLSRHDEDYIAYVIDAVEAAVSAAGYTGHIGRYDGIHNMVRLASDLARDGQLIDEPGDALDGHTVTIWARDLDVAYDTELWRE